MSNSNGFQTGEIKHYKLKHAIQKNMLFQEKHMASWAQAEFPLS